MFPSVDFLGMCVVSSCNAFLRFFMARWVPFFVMPCMRVVQLLLLASQIRGLTLMRMFPFLLTSLLVDSTASALLLPVLIQ
jgi:hypothetical protein